MEDSDTEKDSDGKPIMKASSSVPGLDEYEFKDDDEEEDLSKALNDRHILRRDLRQREKEDTGRNHVAGKQSGKGDSCSKLKKQKTPRVHCSSDTSSDEMECISEKRNSPNCSQSSDILKVDARSKKDNVEQKEKGKVKRKSKTQNRNKENQEDGKENSKTLVLSLATVSESSEKVHEDDCFKMSFSPKDDSSVHLFHLSSIKSPKLNHGLTDKQTPLKLENAKMCVSISESPCQMDTVKYNHYTDADYCTEGSSTKGCKHKEKSKHQLKEQTVEEDDGLSSSYKDASVGNSTDSTDVALRKIDLEGKVVKKHKLKHKEKDKHRREYEAERSRHRQKEVRKEGHRNLEFDREFWKENFFKSDETEESLPVKKEGDDTCSVQKPSDSSPAKDERNVKERHSKEKRPKEEREKEKAVKKERKEATNREEKVKDSKAGERDERVDCHSSGQIPEESLQSNSMKEETDEKPICGNTADQEQLEPSEKGSREKSDKRLPGKEKDSEKMERRHPEKEKKIKIEHAEKSEPQNSVERWKDKDRTGSVSSHVSGDKNLKENEKLKLLSATKKHDEGRKNKEKFDKRSDRERPDRDYSVGDHREKERTNADKKLKPQEKSADYKHDRSKEKDYDRKKKDKVKDGGFSSSSNLKSLLEEKKSYLSENKSLSTKSKDEVVRTPEKDRDRRDRSEKDSERHRDKDKERHKERSQQARIKVKAEMDADKAKSKASPATRDGKPKEKRLVNDDLMQTSFERMLSLKDQEIEQWHRKHLEKIKQKERERLKQRPLADAGKTKPKDRTKSEPCLSKELMRSKSSETTDVHKTDKPPKDRTVSLDGRGLSSISAKVTSAVDICVTRSPRPETERCGLMSRSVSLVSVASSEDSCQAATLTPRHAEFDSDMNLEALDSQPAFLQSSLVIHATRSPSVQDKDCNSLPDVPQSNRSLLSGRHESPYLRAILDDEANFSTKPVETLPKSSLVSEELKTSETSAESKESISPTTSSFTEKEGLGSGCPAATITDKDSLNQNLVPQPVLSACGGSQTGSSEQKTLPCTEPPGVKDVQAVTESVQTDCSGSDHHQPPVAAEPSVFTDTKSIQQKEPLTTSTVENQQQTEAENTQDFKPNNKVLENPEPSEPENSTIVAESFKTEGTEIPALSPIAYIPSSTSGEYLLGLVKTTNESKCPQEDKKLNSKTPKPSSDTASPNLEVQLEKKDFSSPVDVAEERTDVSRSPEHNSTTAVPTAVDGLPAEVSAATEGVPESRTECSSEPMDVTPADDQPEPPTVGEEPGQSTGLLGTQSDSSSSSNTSGSSSPQSGDRESDSSGARIKVLSADDEADVHVPHPRKRKMARVLNSQMCCSGHQEKERGQQSLAAIVDSVKLDEIEPYQTERANPYYEFLHIRKKIEEKRKVLCSVTPQPPQYYDEYVTFNGSYLLDGNPLSKLCIPMVSLSTFYYFTSFDLSSTLSQFCNTSLGENGLARGGVQCEILWERCRVHLLWY